MHPLINAHRQEIIELARRHGVRRLEVFGSILRDDFDESSSDVDQDGRGWIPAVFRPRGEARGSPRTPR